MSPAVERPAAQDAVRILGQLVRRGRIERGWTVAQLSAVLGVSPPTVTAIERGKPGVAVGTVLSAADAVGVDLFGLDSAELARRRRQGEEILALLPQSVVTSRREDVDDDF